MNKILSIEEAADIMGVDYKTIYRLVKSGDIPAAKIGRIFRIRESDLHEYFNQQVEQVKKNAEKDVSFTEQEIRCSFCGNRIFSSLSVGQYCETCSRPICANCSALKNIRFCSEHIKASTTDERKPALKCGRCGIPLIGSARFFSKCKEPGCEELLCRVCSLLASDPYCKKHAKTKLKSEEILKEAVKKGKDVIPSSDAREKELAVIRDVKNRLSRPMTLLEPLSRAEFVTEKAKLKIAQKNSLDELAALCGNKADKKLLEKNYPLDESLIAEFSLKACAFKKNVLLIEARAFSRLPSFAENGFDAEPLKPSELGDIIDVETRSLMKIGVFKALLLASPTGWEPKAAQLITGTRTRQGFRHKLLSVLLLDLKTGELFFNPKDENVVPTLAIFAPEIQEDMIAKAAEWIQEKLLRRSSLTLDDAVRDSQIHEWILKRAFSDLNNLDDYKIDMIDNKLTIYVK